MANLRRRYSDKKETALIVHQDGLFIFFQPFSLYDPSRQIRSVSSCLWLCGRQERACHSG
jgi:hypothetical protein